jgi:hypothetical protein
MSLLGQPFKNVVKSILRINNNTSGATGTLTAVTDGEGTVTPLKIASEKIQITPPTANSTDFFEIKDTGGSNSLFKVDSTNQRIAAYGHYLNTQFKDFHLSSTSSYPTSLNTWTAIPLNGIGAELTNGTATAPGDTLTIATTAHNNVLYYWQAIEDLTISSVNIWYGTDAASCNDTYDFSLMKYNVDSANGSTSGDLTGGVSVNAQIKYYLR